VSNEITDSELEGITEEEVITDSKLQPTRCNISWFNYF